MTEKTQALKGILDTLMSIVRARDFKKVLGIVDEIKKGLDELGEELEEKDKYHKEQIDAIQKKIGKDISEL